VCPANWKPGDKTIVADPEKSLEYFESANKVGRQGLRVAAPAGRNTCAPKTLSYLFACSVTYTAVLAGHSAFGSQLQKGIWPHS
jgi:hypothetical protein